MELKIGNSVKIARKFENSIECWNELMDKTIGQVGKIDDIKTEGAITVYRVRFPDGDWWWYGTESLELVKESSKQSEDTLKKFVLVEVVAQYRMRYVVEVPGDAKCSAKEYAEDTVTCENAKEFSQKYLGETILSSREVSKEEIIHLCNEDNSYVKSWTDDQKFNSFVTKVE